MKIIKKKFDDLIVLKREVFKDKRGYFTENFNKKKFLGIIKKRKIDFYQDNISFSKKGVLRGLHYQTKPYEQGKLISVIKGKIFDVAVDVRPRSKYFGKYFSIELSDKNNLQLWIPSGFAHGFIALKDSIINYKTTKYYSKKHEKTIFWKDKKLQIKWPIKSKTLVSPKDNMGMNFSDIKN